MGGEDAKTVTNKEVVPDLHAQVPDPARPVLEFWITEWKGISLIEEFQ